MNRILIYQPGGVGDVIMTTPALRQFAKDNPNAYTYLAINHRVANSHIADNYPWIDEIVPVRDAWEDFNNHFSIGVREVGHDLRAFSRANKIDKIIELKAPVTQHKIRQYGVELGVKLESDAMEVFIPDCISGEVDAFLKENGIAGEFALVHSVANLSTKNIPSKFITQYISQINLPTIIIDGNFLHCDIHFSFELLRRATNSLLCESAFVPAADALGAKDVVILAWKPSSFKYVDPLHIDFKTVYLQERG